MVQTGRPLRFLARERELERLRRHVEALLGGRGGVALISGVPGIGCTMLARQVAGRALQEGAQVLWGECLPGTEDRPFGGLADALETHALGLPLEVVQADLASDAGPILRLCPALADTVPAFTPAVPLNPADERLRLYEAVVGWLERIARRAPLLIVVDEFQLADGDLLRLLEHLARRLRELPVLVLCVRSLPRTGRRPARLPGALDSLELSGLDEGATAAVLATVADRPVLPATAALVQRVTGGAPLFSLELYRHMAEENLLPGPGSTSLPQPSALPKTLAAVIAWRVARLTPASRSALHVLAAYPTGTEPHIVASVAGLIRARTVEALEALVAARLARTDEKGALYVVAHPAIARALLDALTPLLRAQLHRRVAEALEADAFDRRREMAGALAHHWAASRLVPGHERGVSHCLLAAEQSRAAYAHLRLVDCLRAAVSIAPADIVIQADLLGRLALAEASAELPTEALGTTERLIGMVSLAARGSSHGGLPADVAGVLVDTLRSLRGTGVLPADWPAIDGVRLAVVDHLADRGPRADPVPRARLEQMAERWQELSMTDVAVLHWADLQPAAARTLLDGGNEADRAEVMLPQRPRTPAETTQMAELVRSWRRPPSVLRGLASAVTDMVDRHGLYRDGGGWAVQYLATAERYGSLRDQFRALLPLARCQAALGAFTTADELLLRAEALAARIGDRDGLARTIRDDELTVTRWALAHFRDADWTALVLALPPTGSPRPAGLLLAALRVCGHARLGNEAEARGLLPSVIEATSLVPPLTWYRDAALVAALTAAWEMGAAEHAATGRSLVALAAQAGVGGQVVGTLELTRARLLALSGIVDAARAVFAEQRAALDAAGLLPLRALCDHDEAIAIAAAGPRGFAEATRLLETAGAAFERLGMSGWSARAAQLLDRGLAVAAEPGGRLSFTYPRGLSRHEADVVRLIAGGAAPEEAAATLTLDDAAVERLTASALRKLGGERRDQLPHLARRYGLGGV